MTAYHAKYFAHELTKRCPSDSVGKLAACLTAFLPSSFILQTCPAWVQHFIHHLAPLGMAGFVFANGSMSSNQSGECDIRCALIEADLVDTAIRDSSSPQSEAKMQVLSAAKNNMVALPGQPFYSTQIPVCLWFDGKSNTLDLANDARLFDGETTLSLVA